MRFTWSNTNAREIFLKDQKSDGEKAMRMKRNLHLANNEWTWSFPPSIVPLGAPSVSPRNHCRPVEASEIRETCRSLQVARVLSCRLDVSLQRHWWRSLSSQDLSSRTASKMYRSDGWRSCFLHRVSSYMIERRIYADKTFFRSISRSFAGRWVMRRTRWEKQFSLSLRWLIKNK